MPRSSPFLSGLVSILDFDGSAAFDELLSLSEATDAENARLDLENMGRDFHAALNRFAADHPLKASDHAG